MAGAVTDGPPGDPFELVASRQQLAEGVGRMAEAIESDHPDGVTLVAVLKGASVLVADLSRLLRVPVHIEFRRSRRSTAPPVAPAWCETSRGEWPVPTWCW